jgi:hypothetical protein
VAIEENAALRRVEPALIEPLLRTISHNHQLPSRQVEALFEQITAAVEQVDNDDAAVCAR